MTLTALRPSPQFLVIDAEAMSPFQVAVLAGIRDAGWRGSVIGIGDVSIDMQHSVGVDVIVDRSLGSEVLRNALKHVRTTCYVSPARSTPGLASRTLTR